MGYRSEVAIVIYGEEMPAFKELYNAKFALLSEDAKQCIEDSPADFSENGFKLHLDYVKWYADYEWVQFYDQLFSQANDLPTLCGERIILGEEDGDIEIARFGDSELLAYRIGVSRNIEFN